jgi:[acyl-carrier-protein] S-malonyltransferase
MLAFVFPGQGSQQVGMGRALCETYPYVRARFDEADDALGYKLSTLCFEGPETALVLTQNTQPALLVTSVVAAEVLKNELGLSPALVAGHSLGEYSALVTAGSLSFADAVRLVHLRGRYMQEAVPEGLGAMAAIIGPSAADVAALCVEASQAVAASAPGSTCQAANENGAGQTVISGHKPAVEQAMALAKQRGAKLCKLLPVSAPFHSALMAPAAQRLAEALASVAITAPRIPVIANIDAEPYPAASADPDGSGVRDRLVRQVAGTVRWEACAHQLAALGATTAVEVGQGKVLSGLLKRIVPALPTFQFQDPSGLDTLRPLTAAKNPAQ